MKQKSVSISLRCYRMLQFQFKAVCHCRHPYLLIWSQKPCGGGVGGAKGLPRTNNPGPNLLENVKVTDKESQKKKSFL